MVYTITEAYVEDACEESVKRNEKVKRKNKSNNIPFMFVSDTGHQCPMDNYVHMLGYFRAVQESRVLYCSMSGSSITGSVCHLKKQFFVPSPWSVRQMCVLGRISLQRGHIQ